MAGICQFSQSSGRTEELHLIVRQVLGVFGSAELTRDYTDCLR